MGNINISLVVRLSTSILSVIWPHFNIRNSVGSKANNLWNFCFHFILILQSLHNLLTGLIRKNDRIIVFNFLQVVNTAFRAIYWIGPNFCRRNGGGTETLKIAKQMNSEKLEIFFYLFCKIIFRLISQIIY